MKYISKIPRREREKLKRHNDILEAAKKRFFEKEYDKVSMDVIAKDIELSKSTLYLYFKNKQSLYFAVVLKGMIILRDMFKKAIKSKHTGIEKLLGIAKASFNYMQIHPDYYRLNISARNPRFTKFLDKDNNEQSMIEYAEKYIELIKELLDFLLEAVNLGIKDGTIKKESNPLQTAMFLGSAIETIVYLSPENQLLLDMYSISPKEYFHHSINLLLKGISGDKSKN
ncbi:MAG: TetR/AcrR family transcriptional regulator [Candidatus Lokiarchaeota archaeon]|nr:TetR/AcrR family transcriptional regulator [Candidatus Lokiarchaeota archaeon]